MPRELSAGRGVSTQGEVSAQGSVCRGGCLPRRVYTPVCSLHAGIHTPHGQNS